MIYHIVIILLILQLIVIEVISQADGWRMVDRFFGFRYELVGNVVDVGLEKIIQAKADELACFGWVQKSSNKKALVGEIRCPKARGQTFIDWLSKPNDIQLDEKNILIYEDTKIRLHFSHFKILEDSRDTCFLDKPHQCPDLSNVDSHDKKQLKDEL